jgi:hypothetical protein
MNKVRVTSLLFAVLLFLCTMEVAIGINHFYFQEGLNRDLLVALGLLVLNYGFFIGFSLVNLPRIRPIAGAYALILISLKLFVNTFTIFLFIGLQAVRTHVFVSEFLVAYCVLLMGGVLFLHWNSKQF